MAGAAMSSSLGLLTEAGLGTDTVGGGAQDLSIWLLDLRDVPPSLLFQESPLQLAMTTVTLHARFGNPDAGIVTPNLEVIKRQGFPH
ncbi:hypothetical protein NDU88_002930 [Pleurodeles waltl]|uniref:Uncharacterized protein n=1 Tax=Pleurodeles waltl TaxID=8319 RepID=A0AAV7VE99_PLEWA|nr:hypothetical protein NDU88_002930 [Pleurodeles waltl]